MVFGATAWRGEMSGIDREKRNGALPPLYVAARAIRKYIFIANKHPVMVKPMFANTEAIRRRQQKTA